MKIIITAIVASTSVEVIETNKELGTAKVHALTAWADCGWDCPAERVVPVSALQNVNVTDDGFCNCYGDHDYVYDYVVGYGYKRICANCGRELPAGEVELDEETFELLPI